MLSKVNNYKLLVKYNYNINQIYLTMKNNIYACLNCTIYLYFEDKYYIITRITMSEEYITMQNIIEQLKKESKYWRNMSINRERHSNNLTAEIEALTNNVLAVTTENEEYNRLNARIWDQTKTWVQEDSDIISRQAAQIRFLVGRVKELEKK